MDISKLKSFLLDLIFPKECLGCKKEGSYLCDSCKEKIEINQDFYCVYCQNKSSLNGICSDCQSSIALDSIFVAANYNNKILADLIQSFKYKYVEELGQVLTDLLIKYLAINSVFQKFDINKDNTIIAVVPLHKKRLLSRGFNQSEIIAHNLSVNYNIQVINILKRTVNTASQMKLSRQERLINLKNAFCLDSKVNLNKNKKIILIDDVITTGSTLNECAKVLKQAGFNKIYGLVIAHRE